MVLKCLSEKLQGRVDLYRGLAEWEEVVLIWGRCRVGVSLECAKLQTPIGYPRQGCCVGRWGLELGEGGKNWVEDIVTKALATPRGGCYLPHCTRKEGASHVAQW